MEQNNKYIGTIIQGNKVIFKINDTIYTKKYKEDNKVRRKKYVVSESVNIICDDLNSEYVIIDSDNQVYFNKTILVLNVGGIFASMLTFMILEFTNSSFTISKPICIIGAILLFGILMFNLFYTVLKQSKKIYVNATQNIEGEIIDYKRIEHRHDTDETEHCSYYVMYKYKLPNGNIIHSLVNNYSAKLLYKDYPIGKKVLIKYNPNKCCESCLLDEYEYVFNKKPFVKISSSHIKGIATVTNIKTNCIDNEVEEYLKPYNLVDYIECEYQINNAIYREYSKFAVPHQRFNIGDKISIFFESQDYKKFYCDIPTKYSNLDKHDY